MKLIIGGIELTIADAKLTVISDTAEEAYEQFDRVHAAFMDNRGQIKFRSLGAIELREHDRRYIFTFEVEG